MSLASVIRNLAAKVFGLMARSKSSTKTCPDGTVVRANQKCPIGGGGTSQTPVYGSTVPSPLAGTFTLAENAAAAAVAGALVGVTSGSTLSLINNAGGRVALSSSNVVRGSTALDYETATSHSFTVRETNASTFVSPGYHDTVLSLAVTNVNDSNPNAFTFTDVANAALNTLETSNTITIAGLAPSDSATASISGAGQMRKNGGAWEAGPVTVVNGDTLAVRHTSSSSNSVAVSTTLTVGITSDTFTSTTLAAVNAPPSTGTNLLLGLNVTSTSYDSVNRIESDYRFGAAPASMPSGDEATARDAQGWPTAPNAGDTKVRYVFRNPESSGAHIVITYTAGTGSTVSLFNCTVVVAANDALGTITIAPSDAQPTQTGWALDFTPGSSVPKIISAKEVGDTSTLAATYLAHTTALVVASAPVRTMKATPNVEANDEITVSQTSQAFPAAAVTAAKRNTLTSGDWCYNYNSGVRNDTRPFEADLQAARLTSNATWRCISWNSSGDYVDAVGDAAAQAAIAHGTTSYFEVSNEDWNGGYRAFSQARYEGMSEGITSLDGGSVIVINGTISGTTLTVNSVSSGGNNIATGMPVFGDPPMAFNASIQSFGTGTGGTGTYTLSAAPGNVSNVRMVVNGGLQAERHIEKTIDVMDRIKARFVAAGAPLSKLKRVLAWQNAGMSEYLASHFLDYAPPGRTALKNHIDVFATAPYLNADWVANGTVQVPNSSTTASAFLNAMMVDIDDQIDRYARGAYVAATARGLAYAAYEYGPSPYIDDATTRTAVHHGSGMYDLMMHVFARTEAAVPGSAICNFALPHIDYSNQSFGILQYSGQTIDSSTPKYNAQRDFVAGVRRLQPLVRTSSAPAVRAGATTGTVVATYGRSTYGSAVTVDDTRLVAVRRTGSSLVDIVVASGASFTANGTSSFTITETDARDTRGSLTTDDTLTVSGYASGVHWDINNSYSGFAYDSTDKIATLSDGAGLVKCATGHTSADYSVTVTLGSPANSVIGLTTNPNIAATEWAGSAGSIGWANGGTVFVNGAGAGNLSSYTTGDVIKASYNGTSVSFYKNGALAGSIAFGGGLALYPACSGSGSGLAFSANFTNWS